MNSAGLTGLKQPHKGHVVSESRSESSFSAQYTKPILRPLPVVAHAAHQTLMPSQASALKALTFGADVSSPAELQKKLPLPQQLIIEMQASKDPEEKAVIADMLGRSQVISAVSALLEMTKEQHPPQVRSAAVAALGQIGNGTNPNSYTRATLNQELLKLYDKTKALLKADLLSKANKTDDVDALLQALNKTEKRQDHLSSLKVASVALGQLNVETGRAILLQEFKQSMEKSEEARVISEEIRRAIDIAKEDFVRSLEQQYQKPAEEIMNSLTQKELRALTGGIKVDLPDGQKIGVMQAEEVIRSLDLEQKFSANLMMGLIDGLAQQNDTQINNIVRLGLTSSHADVKAKTLNLLGQRNELNYNSDILPNLGSPHKDVRLAALDALIQANDPAARQAVMEFLKPTKFFATLGQQPSPETMKQFVNFLSHLSNNGDQYILPLIKVAANADFDLERRALAMLVIQSMTQKPFRKNISQQTKQQAGLVIQSMALRPVGKDRAERDEVSLYATTLWVGLKDPNAVVAAVKLADDRFRGLTAKDQESLLEAVYMALQDDYMKARRDVPEPEMARFITRVMQNGDKGGLNEVQFAELEKQLPQTQGQKALNGKPEEVLAAASILANDVAETPFMKATRSVAGNLTPMLARLHKHEKSPTVRMISARLLGLMKAKDQVDQLVGQTREPLKNMMDWSKDPAYKGNPTHDGANIRLNNILALGQLEDPRGVQVMLDALDDPTLRRHVLQPLSQLGKAVSTENNPETLKKVHDKLLMIVENPATSRLQRAIRMAAADTLYQFKGGDAAIKTYLDKEKHPEFKRHVASAFLKNGHGLSPTHPDHAYVKPLLTQGMGVEDLQAKGLTGKGVEIGIIDGGYVDMGNTEAFQGRVRLPAKAGEPEHAHPTMVLTTAGGNGPIKGVAPDVVAYSEMWPDFDSKDPMGVYKKIIEGKVRGENDIRVINNSWGFTDNNILIFKDVRQILKEFKKVVNLAEKAGVLFVFAAGNEGEAPGIPGIGTLSLFGLDVDKLTAESKADLNYIMDKVVLVGASNPLGSDNPKEHRLADFSSIGDSLSRKLVPTVLAPGVDMGVYGYENGKRTKELVNGTSFASPFVTGLTALLWQKNPSLSPAQVREILKKTAVPIPGLPDTYQGHGVVSPKEAVKMAESLIPKKRVKKPKAALAPEAQAQIPPAPTSPSSPTGNTPTTGESPKAPETGNNPESPNNQEAPKTPQEPKRFIA